MRTTALLILAATLAALMLTWTAASAGPQSGAPRPAASDGWRIRQAALDDPLDFTPLVRGRALIHSIIYSSPRDELGTVSVVASADARGGDATLVEIHAPTTAGTGQVDLDVEVPDGLWLRGRGVVTVLFRPL